MILDILEDEILTSGSHVNRSKAEYSFTTWLIFQNMDFVLYYISVILNGL